MINPSNIRDPDGACRVCGATTHTPHCPGVILEALEVEIACKIGGSPLFFRGKNLDEAIERAARVLAILGVSVQDSTFSARYVQPMGDAEDIAITVLIRSRLIEHPDLSNRLSVLAQALLTGEDERAA